MDELTTLLVEQIVQTLDTNDVLAEFMETAAARLRDGGNPHRIAHYLEENARTIRGSRERVKLRAEELLPETIHDPDVRNALAEYLSGKFDKSRAETNDAKGT
jgi:hypothetical protein